jgi:hypothetical protein
MIDLAKFDIATLVPLKSSHDFFTRINGNKVEFIFENINLDFNDATNDGYVVFKIKTKPTLVVGNTFTNNANIYFDYNFPITTYVGQNLGAKKYQRIRKGVHSGTYMALLTSVMISGVMVLFGRNILSLFVSGEPEQIRQVLDIAYKYLFIMAIFLWVLYLLYVYRSAIQGLGNTLIPLASGIAEFAMRVSVALLLPKLIGEDGIFYAEICAWTSAAVLLFISYMIIIRKYKDSSDSSELPAKGL